MKNLTPYKTAHKQIGMGGNQEENRMENIVCAHCLRAIDCECHNRDEEDLEGDYFLFVALPNALRAHKEQHGEYPIPQWNRPRQEPAAA